MKAKILNTDMLDPIFKVGDIVDVDLKSDNGKDNRFSAYLVSKNCISSWAYKNQFKIIGGVKNGCKKF